ncbi:MAG TPA: transposase, partial [Brumimicrobium sp.]|nr:transposase [Brumimicrobium sp.]HTO38023.1 transposase [Brumimicrobium sp.]
TRPKTQRFNFCPLYRPKKSLHFSNLKGIINAIITSTSSAKHENKNGAIQSVIAKARGFRNFERFRINTLFYFGNLNLVPQNI